MKTFEEYILLKEGWAYNKFTEWLTKVVAKVVERVLGPVFATIGGIGMGVIGVAGGYARGGTLGAIYGGITNALLGILGGGKITQIVADWVHDIADKVAKKIKEEENFNLSKDEVVDLTKSIISTMPLPSEISLKTN